MRIHVFLMILLACFAGEAAGQRTVENFDFGWRFFLGDAPGAMTREFDDSAWRAVQLPHDFSIEQEMDRDPRLAANGFQPGGAGWYRKRFSLPGGAAGKRVFVCFDGVYHRADVWVNGRHAGFRPYGYVSYEYELTPLLDEGTNVIAVRVDHSDAPTSRWYSGSGIYRHVRLKVVDPVRVDAWGLRVTTPRISDEEGVAEATVRIVNGTDRREVTRVSAEVLAPDGTTAGRTRTTVTIEAGDTTETRLQVKVARPQRWDADAPNCYSMVARIDGKGGQDEVRERFGFRETTWDPERGFLLNGRSLKLKGVNLHHDGGPAVGAAVPERLWLARLTRLKDMGCNFIRASHNPPDPGFLDVCDTIGLMVMDEAFDKWKSGYYAEYYDRWWRADLLSMLQRDGNHPSIILWSIGNEVAEQGRPEGAARAREMAAFARAHDPTRAVTVGMFPTLPGMDPNEHGFAAAVDVAGHNYNELHYEADRRRFPGRLILGTENYLYYRGPCGEGMEFDDRRHSWMDVAEHDWVVGWTLWAGVDYLGESVFPEIRGWITGFFDSSGRERTISGLFRAFWKDTPEVHLAVLDDELDIHPGALNWSAPKMIDHWNFPRRAHQLVRVRAFSNCDTVELSVNGRSLGRRAVADYPNGTVPWTVPYAPGRLRAVGIRGSERVVKELRSAGEPVAIALESLYPTARADGQDVVLVEASLRDKAGLRVMHDDREITYSVSGAGAFVGADNGDLRVNAPRRASSLPTYFGHSLVIARAGNAPGAVIITATSPGLPTASISIPTH